MKYADDSFTVTNGPSSIDVLGRVCSGFWVLLSERLQHFRPTAIFIKYISLRLHRKQAHQLVCPITARVSNTTCRACLVLSFAIPQKTTANIATCWALS
mmetsp:Transcript_23869/g.55567  ORF Transcript_23869/g.55567 Transcript_23869/m.55567 type:complete len:99 (+) Transcript_23869:87-383(+)